MAVQKYNLEQIKHIYFHNSIKLFEEKYEMSISTNKINHVRTYISHWIYMLKDEKMTEEEAIEDYYEYVSRNVRVPWKKNPEWEDFIKINKSLSLKELIYEFYKYFEVKVTQPAIKQKRLRLGCQNRSGSIYVIRYEDIHPDIYIFPKDHIVESCIDLIPVKCYISGHLSFKNGTGNLYASGCPECKTNFVGGLPIGDNPALVYLLDFEKVNKSKIGYAELGGLSPIEDIHRTSRGRYPWSYEIAAYDLSTKTKAGKYEQDLLKNTINNKSLNNSFLLYIFTLHFIEFQYLFIGYCFKVIFF